MYLPPFSVTFLGTSSATPAYGRYPSSQIVNFHQRLFLIDCGEGTQFLLRKYHFSIQKIEKIFISHLHGDHYFGIFGLLGSMQLLGRTRELKIYAPSGLKALFETIYSASDADIIFPLEFIPLKDGVKDKIYEDSSVSVYSFPMNHRVECFGFIFQEKPFLRKIIREKVVGLSLLPVHYQMLREGRDVVMDNGEVLKNDQFTHPAPEPRMFVHCSDTLFCGEDLKKYFESPDLLYHEATFLLSDEERARKTYHSTALQAARSAQLTRARKLVIGHFSARYKDPQLLLNEAKEVFPYTYCAGEGTEIPVRGEFPALPD